MLVERIAGPEHRIVYRNSQVETATPPVPIPVNFTGATPTQPVCDVDRERDIDQIGELCGKRSLESAFNYVLIHPEVVANAATSRIPIDRYSSVWAEGHLVGNRLRSEVGGVHEFVR